MGKRESLNKENLNLDLEKAASGKKEKGSRRTPDVSTLFSGIVKFILGLCLLPFVWGISISLLEQFNTFDKLMQTYFWSGMVTLVLLHLFIWEPRLIYDKGHRLLEISFGFFQPLVKVAPYLLPIYSIVLLVVYAIVAPLINSETFTNACIFLSGFTIALHLVFAAKTLRSKGEDFLKGNYIFGFSFVYIITLLFTGLCFLVFSRDFSFVNFFSDFLKRGAGVFYAIFRQLFIVG